MVKPEWSSVVLDNDVVEDVCLVPVVDGACDDVVVGGYVLPVKKDAVVWTEVVVFAGVVEDDFVDVKDMFAAVVLSAGVVTVKQDAIVCTIFVVVLADVVEIVFLDNDNLSEADDKLDVDDVLDVVLVGLVFDPIVVDDVVVHVAHVAVDTRPFCVLKVVSLGGNDIEEFRSEVMLLCSIKKHDTFTISFILKGVNKKDRIRYKKSIE